MQQQTQHLKQLSSNKKNLFKIKKCIIKILFCFLMCLFLLVSSPPLWTVWSSQNKGLIGTSRRPVIIGLREPELQLRQDCGGRGRPGRSPLAAGHEVCSWLAFPPAHRREYSWPCSPAGRSSRSAPTEHVIEMRCPWNRLLTCHGACCGQ